MWGPMGWPGPHVLELRTLPQPEFRKESALQGERHGWVEFSPKRRCAGHNAVVGPSPQAITTRAAHWIPEEQPDALATARAERPAPRTAVARAPGHAEICTRHLTRERSTALRESSRTTCRPVRVLVRGGGGGSTRR